MSDAQCSRIRELIPGFVGSRLDDDELDLVDRHVVGCAECRAELELAQIVLAGRPKPPAGLAEAIIAATVRPRRAPSRTGWGLSAAAVAALALGIGIASERSIEQPVVVPGFAYEAEEGEIWLSDDGLVAGEPSLDDLSDEALDQLLVELTTGISGGAV